MNRLLYLQKHRADQKRKSVGGSARGSGGRAAGGRGLVGAPGASGRPSSLAAQPAESRARSGAPRPTPVATAPAASSGATGRIVDGHQEL